MEAQAGQDAAAGSFDSRRVAHAVSVRFYLRAGDRQQRHLEAPAFAQFGQVGQFKKADLRRREAYDVHPTIAMIGSLHLVDVGPGTAMASHTQRAPSSQY